MPFSGAFGVEQLLRFKWDRLQRSIVVLEMPLLSSSEFLPKLASKPEISLATTWNEERYSLTLFFVPNPKLAVMPRRWLCLACTRAFIGFQRSSHSGLFL